MPMFPPRPGRQRPRNKSKKPLIAFRPRHDQMEVVDRAVDGGYEKTEVLIAMMDLAIDFEREAGDALTELEWLARQHQSSVGTMAGRAVKFGIAALKAQLGKSTPK